MCTKPNVKAIERNRGNLKDVGRYGRRVSSRMMATPWRMKNVVASHVAWDCVKNRVDRFCVVEEKQCACVYLCERERE